MKTKMIFAVFLSFLSLKTWAVAPGEMVSNILLEYSEGKKVDGSGAFNTDSMKGKIAVLFYVDPDVKDLNEGFSQALAKKNYSLDKYGSYAVINMAATWLPNFAIEASLAEKQKTYPRVVYVMDFRKNFVKKWGLSDDNSVVVIMDKAGKVLYRFDGKMEDAEIKKAITIIDSKINA